jgi:tRNA 2-thiocytidine biosynthesis protein TtcA
MATIDTMAFYLLKSLNKAHRHYRLLDHGDRILVAVSGGKDSLTLLDLLHRRRHSGPENVELVAGHVTSDYHCGRAVPLEWLADWCSQRDIPLVRDTVAVADTITTANRSRCFWCAWERRRALFRMAESEGCRKLAFGHHADDLAETTLMNLFYSSRVESMKVRSELFGGRLTLIRPLALIEERDIAAFARVSGYPIQGEPCPEGARSRRAFVREILRQAEAEHRGVKRSMHHALRRCEEIHSAAGD